MVQKKRNNYEEKNLGGYELIYPNKNETNMAYYEYQMQEAKKIWFAQTNGRSAQKEKP